MPPRRIKTYTAETGYVYQYYFVGQRAALADDPDAPGTEYIYDVSSDRKTTFAVSIIVKPEALGAWQAAHGRALTGAEQYATAKLRMLAGFDSIEKMVEAGRRLVVDAAGIEELLEPLSLT